METHTQTLLVKNDIFQYAWIPSKYAKVGGYVKLRRRGAVVGSDLSAAGSSASDGWDNGWKVESAGTILESSFVNERSQDHKNMRKVTDI